MAAAHFRRIVVVLVEVVARQIVRILLGIRLGGIGGCIGHGIVVVLHVVVALIVLPLAIVVAQVDEMSGGRVELGLGAGWFAEEHEAYAIPFPPLGERFDRLDEQLQIITGFWDTPVGEHFDFAGKHYTVKNSPALPKPAQAHPPVIIGGGKRGVVTTACYIARMSGAKSAMPMFKALKLCPDAVVIKPNFAKYKEESRRIHEKLDRLTPLIQPLSLDEAWIDLTGTERLHGAPPAVMLARLQAEIEHGPVLHQMLAGRQPLVFRPRDAAGDELARLRPGLLGPGQLRCRGRFGIVGHGHLMYIRGLTWRSVLATSSIRA